MAWGREKQVAISQMIEMLSTPFVSDILCFRGFRMTCNRDTTLTFGAQESQAPSMHTAEAFLGHNLMLLGKWQP